MYQRYYKQRKFGRIFSFCMVVGSGLSYYIKTSVKSIKNLFKIDNLSAYSEYLPENMRSVVDNLKELKKDKVYYDIKSELSNINSLSREDLIDNFREDKFSIKNRYWIYKNNLNRSNNIRSDNYQNKEDKNKINTPFLMNEIPTSKEQVKLKETYKLYRKIKIKT